MNDPHNVGALGVIAFLAIMVFAIIGVGYAVALTGEWLRDQPRFQKPDAKPEPECKHEWEPWSEPKDDNIKRTVSHFGYIGSSGGTTESGEYIGKFQDRVCSKCNIYERRWA